MRKVALERETAAVAASRTKKLTRLAAILPVVLSRQEGYCGDQEQQGREQIEAALREDRLQLDAREVDRHGLLPGVIGQ